MLKRLVNMMVAATALLGGAAAANAGVTVEIEQNGFGGGPIEVISENGTSWTKILESDLTLPVKVKLGISSGDLVSYAIKQTTETLYSSGEWVDGPSSYETTKTVTGSTKNFSLEHQFIIDACNAKLNVGEGINQEHTFWHAVQLELVGYFVMTNDENYPPYSGYGTVAVPVTCKPKLPASNDVAADHGPLLIKEAKLFLTTVNTGQNTGVTLGGCKALKTTVRFETNQLGPVSFDLHRFPGGMTKHTVNAEFEPDTGKYYARYHKYETFEKTTSVQYMAMSTSPSAGNTGWKGITVHCGGGLSQNPNPNNPDNDLPQGSTVEGDFSFVDSGGTKCPRQGKALLSFKSPKQDNVHYSLDCTNGHFSGVAQTVPNPNGSGYLSAALVTFDVNKTTQANCALKTVAPYAPKTHTLKGHLFQCVKRNAETGPDDLQAKPDPTHGSARKPKVLVPDASDKAEADARKRAEAAKKAAEEAKRKRAEAAKKAAKEAKRKRAEAAKKAAEEAKRKRAEAAKKAAEEAKRKRAEAAKKAAEETKRKRAEAAKKAAEEAKRKREAAKKRRKANTGNGNAGMQILRLR